MRGDQDLVFRDPEVEEAWMVELARREAEIKCGAVVGIPAVEAMAKIRAGAQITRMEGTLESDQCDPSRDESL